MSYFKILLLVQTFLFLDCVDAQDVYVEYTDLEDLFCDSNTVESASLMFHIYSNDSIGLAKCRNLKNIKFAYVENLPNLFKELAFVPSLRHVDLTDNQIEEIPTELGLCTQLNSLVFEGNSIQVLPECFSKLLHLKYLDASANKIHKIHEGFYNAIALEKLILKDNRIDSISPLIGQLENLQYLKLNSNNISFLPTEITEAQDLNYLSVSANPIKNDLSFLFQIENLRTLRLRNIGIDTLSISSINNIEDLDLRNNKLWSIYFLNNCKALKKLRITQNKLDVFDVDCENLKLLESLEMRFCGLKELNSTVGKLESLEIIDLSGNELVSLPSEFFNNRKLNTLHIMDNKLTEISPLIGDLSNLEVLVLASNLIKKIPSSISKLNKLKLLNLSNNQISEITSSIEDLSSLVEMNLGINRMTQFDLNLIKMENFIELDLHKNNITKINLYNTATSKLEEFDIGDNLMQSLPIELFELKNLKELDMDNNPITSFSTRGQYLDQVIELSLSGLKLVDYSFLEYFPNLTTLDITNLNLIEFPFDFNKLSKLENIEINGNNFDDFQLDELRNKFPNISFN